MIGLGVGNRYKGAMSKLPVITPVGGALLPDDFSRLEQAFSEDGLVAFPTESLYGLAVNPRSEGAIARLFELKERPPQKPIALIASDLEAVESVGELSWEMKILAKEFWPGPLTLVLEASGGWPAALQAGRSTLGVRVSGLAIARDVARAAGGLVTATSANKSGDAGSAHLDEVDAELLQKVSLIVDGGTCQGGVPSTVLGQSEEGLVVFREGAVSVAQIKRLLPDANVVTLND
ncbi:threonylcarbamoyl-AMP synthase [Myxococcota bacterium]|nr:threonylcarbamoyl-AMP synthase [Myxococcota bacterium]